LSKQRKESKPGTSFRRGIRIAAEVAALLAITLVIGALSGCCERLFFYPDATLYFTPSDYGLQYEAVRFSSGDGTQLAGWFLPARGRARGTIVHCHGNAQNMTAHWRLVQFLPENGFNLFVFDYRGYGRSKGKPTRRGVIDDSRAAVDYVFSREDVDPARVGLMGHSLGGAAAFVVAAEDDRLRALATDSAFSSYRDEAAYVLRRNPVTFLPAWPLSRLLIRGGFDPVDYAPKLSPRPVFIIHGTADRIVPHHMGERLAAAAGKPKELWLVEGARHMGGVDVEGEKYVNRVCRFFGRAFGE
jgi:hypothetical protein